MDEEEPPEEEPDEDPDDEPAEPEEDEEEDPSPDLPLEFVPAPALAGVSADLSLPALASALLSVR